MRILFVAPWIPAAQRPRSLQILRHLQEEHDVSFVGALWHDDDQIALDQLEVVNKVGVRLGRIRAAVRALAALVFSNKSLQQAYVSAPQLQATIRSAIAEHEPDLLFFNVNRTAQFRQLAPHLPAVVDLDEYRSAYFRQLGRTSSNIGLRLVSRIEASRIERAEADLPAYFRRIFISSPVDVDRAASARLVRSTVEVPADEIDRSRAVPASIVFSGRQSYRANEEAISWFWNEVFPSVRSRIPNAHLTVVGANPPLKVQRMASKNVVVTGTVPDIRPYLEEAAVSVIPVRHATGVQLKLLEAMAAGSPCVVTPVVAAGAGVHDGIHCLVADTPEEWTAAVARLLEDDELRARISGAAFRWLRENHSASVTRNALLQELGTAIDS